MQHIVGNKQPSLPLAGADKFFLSYHMLIIIKFHLIKNTT